MSKRPAHILTILGLLSLGLMTYAIIKGQQFYQFRGCREEDYPELAFLVFGVPLSLVSICLGLLTGTRRSMPRRKLLIAGSLVSSLLCIALLPAVAFEFGGDQSYRCR